MLELRFSRPDADFELTVGPFEWVETIGLTMLTSRDEQHPFAEFAGGCWWPTAEAVILFPALAHVIQAQGAPGLCVYDPEDPVPEQDEPRYTFTVVGYYPDNSQRYATTVLGRDHEEAEVAAKAQCPGMVVAGSFRLDENNAVVLDDMRYTR